MSEKRKCIFTGNLSDFKLTFPSSEGDPHNWIKAVPTTKEYVEESGLLKRALYEPEIQLVELFYEQEVFRLRANNIEVKMAKIRANIKEGDIGKPMPTHEYFAQLGGDSSKPPSVGEYFTKEIEDSGYEIDEGVTFPKGREDLEINLKENTYYTIIDEPDTPVSKECYETKLKPTKVLTEEKKDAIVEKRIVTKKKGIWD